MVGGMYRETTQGIEVEAHPQYLSEHSDPAHQRFLFGYRILVRNVGKEPAQLMSRHWVITDGKGETREVRGPGVVGEQPVILPGETYEYSSFCPLRTPTGNMRGTYTMVRSNQLEFQVKIPLFFLRQDSQTLH